MTNSTLNTRYSIQVTLKGSEYVASIPELCIAEKGTTPQEALLAILQTEENTRKILQAKGLPLPPDAHLMDPFSKATRFVVWCFPFIAKIAMGYALVMVLTAMLLAVAFPSVRSRIEEYVTSQNATTDVGKVLSKLGISICSEKP